MLFISLDKVASLCCKPVVCKQGTDDLEEAMSERLQELPPPLGRHNSNSKQDGDGDFSFPQDMDTEVVGPNRVSTNTCSTASTAVQQAVLLGVFT